MLDYHAYEAMTFDCYGTLIDWETGLADELAAALGGGDPELLPSRYETEAEYAYMT
jgi:2-haloacid dehalogenase